MFGHLKNEMAKLEEGPEVAAPVNSGPKVAQQTAQGLSRQDKDFPSIALTPLNEATLSDLRRTVTRGVVFGLFFWSLWVALIWFAIGFFGAASRF